MEITTQNVPETPPKPQHITVSTDAWTFDPANPTAPVLMTQGESNRLDPIAWAIRFIANRWHEIMLTAATIGVGLTLTTPFRLGINYPLETIPPSFMLVFFIGVGFMTRSESKRLTAWVSAVCMAASGYTAAAMGV